MLIQGIELLQKGYDEWNLYYFERAVEIFENVIEEKKDSYLPYYWKGVAQFHIATYYLYAREKDKADDIGKENINDAIETFEKALDLNKDEPESYALLATVIGMKIETSPFSAIWLGPKVMKYKDKAVELAPENPRVHYLTGVSYYHAPKMMGGGEKSLEHLLKAETLFEQEKQSPVISKTLPRWGYSACLVFIARVYRGQGTLDLAEKYYRKALAVNPNDILAREGIDELITIN